MWKALRILCIAFALVVSPVSFAKEELDKTIRWGFSAGFANGVVGVSKDPGDIYNAHHGIGRSYGLLVERSLSPTFAASASFESVNSLRLGLFNDNSLSKSYFVSIGGTLGRIDLDGSAYISAGIGYSYVKLDGSGDPQVSCFLCASYRRGGSGYGLGYRLALGRAISKQVRAEVVYSYFSAEDSSFPDNAKGEFSAWRLVMHILAW